MNRVLLSSVVLVFLSMMTAGCEILEELRELYPQEGQCLEEGQACDWLAEANDCCQGLVCDSNAYIDTWNTCVPAESTSPCGEGIFCSDGGEDDDDNQADVEEDNPAEECLAVGSQCADEFGGEQTGECCEGTFCSDDFYVVDVPSCEPKVAVGEYCSSLLECITDDCVDNVCAEEAVAEQCVEAGDQCADEFGGEQTGECCEGTFCSDDFYVVDVPSCEPKVAVGEYCNSPVECITNNCVVYVCAEETVAEQCVEAGDQCADEFGGEQTGECCEGTYCDLEYTYGDSMPSCAPKLLLEEYCATDNECLSGACHENTCVDTIDQCVSDGAPCSNGDGILAECCSDDMFCSIIDAGMPAICTPKYENGATCPWEDYCLSGICVDYICVAEQPAECLSTGDDCLVNGVFGAPCCEGTYCNTNSYEGLYECVPVGADGDTCFVHDECASGFCIDNSCASGPTQCIVEGEPCAQGHGGATIGECCSDSYCDHGNPYVNPVPVCAAKSPAGSFCTDDVYCMSGSCIENACAQ